ncbi:type I MADS-domain transcription factor [Selaginella moellendorffii]|uniref:Type I MADS-domain transcription factor n=1 Tax=Selaginella moellendorffii TaxID=88036 RepID=D8R6R2_SELML|nr:developmental protein SEPALLATA 3 [Selaginella moellendorffii]EFJ32357.1 type I MADS-domain transcription factor [Selaginella moellendorffii]|eukprot:XP_002966330.1 developmental protein SEPALLATA 3 [Selaginella moellendorffii]
MGRCKIEIKYLTVKSNRNATFRKRSCGLMKKADEIHILCGAELMLEMEPEGGTPRIYASEKRNDYVSNPRYHINSKSKPKDSSSPKKGSTLLQSSKAKALKPASRAVPKLERGIKVPSKAPKLKLKAPKLEFKLPGGLELPQTGFKLPKIEALDAPPALAAIPLSVSLPPNEDQLIGYQGFDHHQLLQNSVNFGLPPTNLDDHGSSSTAAAAAANTPFFSEEHDFAAMDPTSNNNSELDNFPDDLFDFSSLKNFDPASEEPSAQDQTTNYPLPPPAVPQNMFVIGDQLYCLQQAADGRMVYTAVTC